MLVLGSRMKLTQSLTIWLLGACGLFSSAHAINVAGQVSSQRQEPSLQLSTIIVSQKYCAGDAELDGLRMKLLLHYTNTGQQPIILYKGSSFVSRVMVSRSTEDAAARRFEVNASLTQVTEGGDVKVEAPTPGPLFVILAPDTSFDTEESVSVFAVRGDMRRIEGAISSGEHVLQIEVPTWPASNDLAKNLHDLWQRSGYLWYEPVVSAPMRFKVETKRSVRECS
jgi:hypothetical protein